MAAIKVESLAGEGKNSDDVRKELVNMLLPCHEDYAARVKQALKGFKASVATAAKTTKKAKSADAGDDKATVTPFKAMLKQLGEKLSPGLPGPGMAESYEGLGAAPRAVQATASEAMVRDMSRCKGISVHAKWLKKELARAQKDAEKQKEPVVTVLVSDFKPGVAKEVQKVMLKHLPLLHSKARMSADCSAMVDTMFGCQQFAVASTHAHLGITPYGVGEVRVLLERELFHRRLEDR